MPKSLLIALANTSLCLATACAASDMYVEPLQVCYELKDHSGTAISVTACKSRKGDLGTLALKAGDNEIAVPAEELAGIWNPELYTLRVIHGSIPGEKGDDFIRFIKITMEFGRRPFGWGQDHSTADFIFYQNDYQRRSIATPTAENRRKTVQKPRGKPETPAGEGGAIPGGE